MLTRALVYCALTWSLAAPLFAEDATVETTIEFYRVGDLVSDNTLRQAEAWDRISPDEWRAEHAETIASLERLESLVRTMCCQQSEAVQSHRETLSLVVRHTADGHREIDQLLQALRSSGEPSIRLTCQPICGLSGKHLESLSAEKQKRAAELLMRKTTLTPDEAREVRETLTDPEYAHYVETVELVAGRKASWGNDQRPATATARIAPGTRLIQLRLDYIVDDVSDTFPVGSQVFDIPEGRSAVSHHMCDGGTLIWLITPSKIEPVAAAKAEPHGTTTK